MICKFVVSLVMIGQVLSEPDLCQNPKLDSIVHLSDDNMWFFTSGGYYWYIKDSDFPPGGPTGKLPNGFKRGDAAFYCDYFKVCTSVADSRQDRVIVLIEMGSDSNNVIEFDRRNVDKRWSDSYTLSKDKRIGKSNIQITKEIDATFTLSDSHVFMVQKNRYAANDWKPTCRSGDQPQRWPSYDVGDLQSSSSAPFDAIFSKGKTLYYFIGHNFWEASVSSESNGRLIINKGTKKNTSTQFFRYKECAAKAPEVVATEGSQQQNPTEGENQENPNNERPAEGPGGNTEGPLPVPNVPESSDEESSGGSGVFLIVLIVVILIVVVLVIGGVVYAMQEKSVPDQEKNKIKGLSRSLKPKEAKPVNADKKAKPSKK